MIFAFGSRKASPGVTTLASVLAAVWPAADRTRLVLEADPAGGALAARWSAAHALSWDPGLLALSTTRREIEPGALDGVAQPLAEGLWVAAAPPAPEQITAALTRFGSAGAEALAASDVVSFIDCGRLTAESPAVPLARVADCTILVCRPRLDEVYALMPAVGELTEAGCTLGLVVVDDGPYPPHEVAESLGVELLGSLPHDRRGVAAIDARGVGGRVARRRSEYVQAVLALGHRLRRIHDPDAEPGTEPSTVRVTRPAGRRAEPRRADATTTGTMRVTPPRAAYFERPAGWEAEAEPGLAAEPAVAGDLGVAAEPAVAGDPPAPPDAPSPEPLAEPAPPSAEPPSEPSTPAAAGAPVEPGSIPDLESRPSTAPPDELPPPPTSRPPAIVGPQPAASRWPQPMAPSRLAVEEPGPAHEREGRPATISYAPPTGVDQSQPAEAVIPLPGLDSNGELDSIDELDEIHDLGPVEEFDEIEPLPVSLAVVAAKTPDGRPVWHHGGPGPHS